MKSMGSVRPDEEATVTEREITERVDLCLPDGRLNPEAIGWTRQSLHNTNLSGWGRNKRFEYWSVTTPGFILALNISHHDYRANISVTFLDRETLQEIKQGGNRWFPTSGGLRDPSGQSAAEARRKRILVRLTPNSNGTALFARSERISVDLQALEEPGHESMGVVVPWSRRTFQYTKKDNCLGVEGTVVVDGTEFRVDPASSSATHDRGRGRWPYFTLWNWGSATGHSGGYKVGLQFGGKWTDGTGSTENWLRLDGRLHKISDELIWDYNPADWLAPWTITGSHVRISFRPVQHVTQRFNRWIVLNRADSCYGYYSGQIILDSGAVVEITDVFGHVEEVERRW